MTLSPVDLDASGGGAFAALLRQYRNGRRLSQLDLALDCDVSARHLSFLETGRARPSREMVLQIAEGLLLPLANRNALLLAAGFAPVFPASPLQSEALGPLRAVLQEMMDRHAPWPAMLCDRHWMVRDANPAARTLLAPFAGDAAEMNIVRMLTESPQAPELIENYAEVLQEMRSRIALEALEAGNDPVLRQLQSALDAACHAHPHSIIAPRRPLMPTLIRTPGGRLSFLSAIAQFGTSQDVTVRDLRLELLFPADDFTRAALKEMAG